MTWWRRLLRLPEPKYCVGIVMNQEEYDLYFLMGWNLGVKHARMDITSDTITITRRPMSRPVTPDGAEGAQPQADESQEDK